MNRLSYWVGCVLMCGFMSARVAPRTAYDRMEAWVTLPVSLSTRMEDFLAMGEGVVRAVASHPVRIELKAYVLERTPMRERMYVQSVVQRLERRMHAALPGVSLAVSSLDEVPEARLLPAWRMSTVRTVPRAYVAIVVHPVTD